MKLWTEMNEDEKEWVGRFHKFWDRIDNVLGHDLSWGEVSILVVKTEIITPEEMIRLFGIKACEEIQERMLKNE